MGIFLRPSLCQSRVARFNVIPGKHFPLAKVNFAQHCANMKFDSEMASNSLGSLLSAQKVACIDSEECMFRQQPDESRELLASALIEAPIRVAAEAAGHVGFRMTDEKKMSPAFH